MRPVSVDYHAHSKISSTPCAKVGTRGSAFTKLKTSSYSRSPSTYGSTSRHFLLSIIFPSETRLTRHSLDHFDRDATCWAYRSCRHLNHSKYKTTTHWLNVQSTLHGTPSLTITVDVNLARAEAHATPRSSSQLTIRFFATRASRCNKDHAHAPWGHQRALRKTSGWAPLQYPRHDRRHLQNATIPLCTRPLLPSMGEFLEAFINGIVTISKKVDLPSVDNVAAVVTGWSTLLKTKDAAKRESAWSSAAHLILKEARLGPWVGALTSKMRTAQSLMSTTRLTLWPFSAQATTVTASSSSTPRASACVVQFDHVSRPRHTLSRVLDIVYISALFTVYILRNLAAFANTISAKIITEMHGADVIVFRIN